MKTIQSIF